MGFENAKVYGYQTGGGFSEVDYKSWGKLIHWANQETVKLRLKHIEAMAAAFFAKTDIPPEEVVLVEDRTEPHVIRFYFERREKA